MEIKQYWEDVIRQNKESLKQYFLDPAIIRWHNTNEQFTVDEFLQANCDYPGVWFGEIIRIDYIEENIITVVRIWTSKISFHVTSFFTMESNKIKTIDEYWGEDGPAPEWRLEKNIGEPIK